MHGRGNDYHEWEGGGNEIKCTTRRQVTSVYGAMSGRKLAEIRRTGTGRVGAMRCCGAAKVEVSCKGRIAETSKLCDVSVISMTMTVDKRGGQTFVDTDACDQRRMNMVTGGVQGTTLRGPAQVPASRKCAAWPPRSRPTPGAFPCTLTTPSRDLRRRARRSDTWTRRPEPLLRSW